MVNLANVLDTVSGGEPLEVIDRDTKISINPKEAQLLHPFNEYEILSIYSGIDSRYHESYIVFEVRRYIND